MDTDPLDKKKLMRHLSLLVPNGEINLSSVIGSYKVFRGANRYQKSMGKPEIFDVQLVGVTDHADLHGGRFTIRPDVHIRAIPRTDLIIIPAISHAFTDMIAINGEITQWLSIQYGKGAHIAAICTGAFLLAPTGILEGRTCSTHWG